jgi:predicted nucleic acid-binding protein
MTAFVVDASIALAWCFDDERTPETERLFDLVNEVGGVVPGHWRLEVANSLRTAIRRGRIDAAYQIAAIHHLSTLRLETDTETDRQAWSEILSLSTRLGLTPYDAAYLELSLRRDLPLATLDRRLALAAAEISEKGSIS